MDLAIPNPQQSRIRVTLQSNVIPILRTGVFLCILLAIWIRFNNISTQSFWHDELYTLANINGFDAYTFEGADLLARESPKAAGDIISQMFRHDFITTWYRNIIHEGHPPLYGLLLKIWSLAFGQTELGLRSFSAFMSIFTGIPLFFCVRRIAGEWAALLAIGVFATSPFHIYFAQEARSYALAVFFCAMTGWATVELCSRNDQSTGWWAIWCLSATASMYTHFYTAIFCFLLLPALWREQPNTSKAMKVILLLTPFVLLALWLPVLRKQMHAQSAHWTNGSTDAWSAIVGFTTGIKEMLLGVGKLTTLEAVAGIGIFLIASAVGLLTSDRRVRLVTIYLISLVLMHGMLVYVLDLALNHHMILIARFSIGLSIVLPVLVGLGASRLGIGGSIAVLILMGVSGIAALETSVGTRAPKQMFYQVAGFLNANVQPGEPVIITPSGPTLIGIARVVQPGMVLLASPATESQLLAKAAAEQCGTAWIVEQRLGLDIEAWKMDASRTSETVEEVTHFAGMDVRRVKAK